jgi:hypothetical protein
MALTQLVVDGKTPKAAPDAFWELVRTYGNENQKVYDAMIGVMVEFMNFKDSPDRWFGKKSNAQGLADILFMTADRNLKDLPDLPEAANKLFFRNRAGVQNSWGKFYSAHEYAAMERKQAALAKTGVRVAANTQANVAALANTQANVAAAQAAAKKKITAAIAAELMLMRALKPPVGKAEVDTTLTYDNAVGTFVTSVTEAQGKKKTTELVKTISEYPQIVTKTWKQKDGTKMSTLQLIVQAAIADAADKPLPKGVLQTLRGAVGRVAKSIGSVKLPEISNPLLRRRRQAALREAAYKEGGATQADWAAVVTQILRTPYVYDDSVMEENLKTAREARSAQKNYTLGPDVNLERRANKTSKSLLLAESLAIQDRKDTPRPSIAFSDLIAMRSITEPAVRNRAATNLVPVLKAFTKWRDNVIFFPLLYTPEQVVDAQHLLDGMTADTNPEMPFLNASLTLRRDINEKRGANPTDEERAAKEAEDVARAQWEASNPVPLTAEQAKARAAAEARAAAANEPGGQAKFRAQAAATAARAREAEAAAAAQAKKAAEDANFQALMQDQAALRRAYEAEDADAAAAEAEARNRAAAGVGMVNTNSAELQQAKREALDAAAAAPVAAALPPPLLPAAAPLPLPAAALPPLPLPAAALPVPAAAPAFAPAPAAAALALLPPPAAPVAAAAPAPALTLLPPPAAAPALSPPPAAAPALSPAMMRARGFNLVETKVAEALEKQRIAEQNAAAAETNVAVQVAYRNAGDAWKALAENENPENDAVLNAAAEAAQARAEEAKAEAAAMPVGAGGKRRRRKHKTPKRRRVRKSRKSTFRRHRKH